MTAARPLILVVEDDAFIALDLAEQLEAAGFEVLGPAPSVREALAVLAARRPQAAVIDVQLKVGTSADLARELISLEVPFVTASGYDVEQHPEVFHGHPHVPKPVDIDKLVGLLRKLIP